MTDEIERRARSLIDRYGDEAVLRVLRMASGCDFRLAEYTDWIEVAAAILRIRSEAEKPQHGVTCLDRS